MAITYNDTTKQIIIDGQTATPESLLVIAGVTRHGDVSRNRYSYHIPFNILLQNGATFNCTDALLVFSENLHSLARRFVMDIGCYVIINNSTWFTPSRSFITFFNATIDNTYFLHSRGITHSSGCTVKKTVYNDCGSLYFYSGINNNFTDCTVTHAAYGLIPQSPIMGINLRNKLIECAAGMLVGYNGVDQNIYNLQVIDSTYDFRYLPTQTVERQTNLIDCLVDPEKSIIQAGTVGRKCRLNLKSTFNFIIEGGDTGTAYIYDKDGNLYDEITLSGTTTKEIMFYSRYVEYATPSAIDIITTYQPFTVTISKDGYQDLTINDLTVTPGQPTVIRGELVPITPPVYYNQQIDATITAEDLTGNVQTNTINGIINISNLTAQITIDE